MKDQFNPRKFRVSITEVFDNGKQAIAANGTAKTIDYEDCKPIYDLFCNAKTYNDKHNITPRTRGIKLIL